MTGADMSYLTYLRRVVLGYFMHVPSLICWYSLEIRNTHFFLLLNFHIAMRIDDEKRTSWLNETSPKNERRF